MVNSGPVCLKRERFPEKRPSGLLFVLSELTDSNPATQTRHSHGGNAKVLDENKEENPRWQEFFSLHLHVLWILLPVGWIPTALSRAPLQTDTASDIWLFFFTTDDPKPIFTSCVVRTKSSSDCEFLLAVTLCFTALIIVVLITGRNQWGCVRTGCVRLTLWKQPVHKRNTTFLVCVWALWMREGFQQAVEWRWWWVRGPTTTMTRTKKARTWTWLHKTAHCAGLKIVSYLAKKQFPVDSLTFRLLQLEPLIFWDQSPW